MWRLEVQFQRFCQIGKSLFLGLALAGDVEFQALGDVPLPFTPNCRREWSLHDLILSQGDAASHTSGRDGWHLAPCPFPAGGYRQWNHPYGIVRNFDARYTG